MASQPDPMDNDDFRETLHSQTGLYDLHTHLMGNGSYEFWIEEILEDPKILPPHTDFIGQPTLRKNLCPLIWDQDGKCFVDGDTTAVFIDNLRAIDFPLGSGINQLDCLPVLESLITKETSFVDRLMSLGLSFKNNFSYDVVLKLSDLGIGLGVKESIYDDFIQIEVEEKLGILRSKEDDKLSFCHYIIFNARKQCFEIVFGITAETLRELINVNKDSPADSPQRLARGHLINAFSMCHSDGTPAGHVDFHGFHGAFTPEFYPRRFALKDSIYEQRLDVLFLLLNHIFDRYSKSKPPIIYCELSISIGDLSSPWIFEILRSMKTPSLSEVKFDDSVLQENLRQSSGTSKFCTLINEGHFSHLKDKLCTKVTYKFLAGFKRQNIQSPIPSDQMEALSLLNEAPQLAIHYMLKEIVRSDSDSKNPNWSGKLDCENVFFLLTEQLSSFQEKASEIPEFYHWVVGIDLFGDELGYPYCPFVAWPFIDYVLSMRKNNKCFGMRIHCGENVMFADNDIGSYRLFVAHMYIVFRCLRYLQRKLEYGIRIGHGIAFERILSNDMRQTTHRKSAVLLAEIRQHAKHVLKTIAFEVNITSNEYLLRYSIRQGNQEQTHKLEALFKLGVPVFLSTDDDGVWPIQACKWKHDGHLALAAEYCRALSSSIFKSKFDLETAFNNTKIFCFFPVQGRCEMPKAEVPLPEDDERISTIIFHPDLIKVVLQQCFEGYKNDAVKIENDPFCQHYQRTYSNEEYLLNNENWIDLCKLTAPLAYVVHCTDESVNSLENIKHNYLEIFGNTDNLKSIHENWSNIRMQLIFPNIENRAQHVSICDEKYVFLSEQPLSERKVPDHLIDFLQDNYHREVQINAYARHVNVLQFVTTLKEQLKRPCHSSLSIALYTNRDKTKCPSFHIDGTKIQIVINYNPLKRTYKERTQENTFYAICPHARAATAALHFVIYSLTDRDLPQNIQPHPSTYVLETQSSNIDEVLDLSLSIPTRQNENATFSSQASPPTAATTSITNSNSDDMIQRSESEDRKRTLPESELGTSKKTRLDNSSQAET